MTADTIDWESKRNWLLGLKKHEAMERRMRDATPNPNTYYRIYIGDNHLVCGQGKEIFNTTREMSEDAVLAGTIRANEQGSKIEWKGHKGLELLRIELLTAEFAQFLFTRYAYSRKESSEGETGVNNDEIFSVWLASRIHLNHPSFIAREKEFKDNSGPISDDRVEKILQNLELAQETREKILDRLFDIDIQVPPDAAADAEQKIATYLQYFRDDVRWLCRIADYPSRAYPENIIDTKALESVRAELSRVGNKNLLPQALAIIFGNQLVHKLSQVLEKKGGGYFNMEIGFETRVAISTVMADRYLQGLTKDIKPSPMEFYYEEIPKIRKEAKYKRIFNETLLVSL